MAQPTLAASADTWRFTGPGGGYVRAFAIDPTGVIYAGTDEGGVFQSQDGGLSWGAMNVGLPRAAVRALAIDPEDAATLYAGTRGAGVFRSEDAGAHWMATNTGLSSVEINALAIDPARANVMYAGTADAGLFVSSDRGASWRHVNLGGADSEINFVAVDPATSTTVYAATQGGGVFKTDDDGRHWRALAESPRYVNALAIDPSTPSTIYSATFGVSKSVDGGVTWVEVNEGLRLNGYTPQILSLVIDSDDPATVWAGTIDLGAFRSRDDGMTWTQVTFESPDATYPHFAAWAFAVDPTRPDALYVGGYGVLASTDDGENWNSSGLPGRAQATALAIDPAQPDVLYLAAAYGEGVFKSVDGATRWSRAGAGLPPDVNDIAIDLVDSATLYAATGGGVFKSIDAGGSWQSTPLAGGTNAIVIAATDPPTILAASYDPERGYDIYVSNNAGATWDPSGVLAGYISGLAVDPHDPLTVYGSGVPLAHSLESRGIIKTIDLGAHWTLTGLRSFDSVYPLAVDPQSSMVVYAGYRAGLLLSRDGGATWRAANNGLPDSAVSQLLFDPSTAADLCCRRRRLRQQRRGGELDGCGNWSQRRRDGPGHRSCRRHDALRR